MKKKKKEITDQERHIQDILRKREKIESAQRPIEFPKGEPEYWYGEFDVKNKMLEVRLDDFIVRIPQETVLSWFMHTEYNSRLRDGKTECP